MQRQEQDDRTAEKPGNDPLADAEGAVRHGGLGRDPDVALYGEPAPILPKAS